MKNAWKIYSFLIVFIILGMIHWGCKKDTQAYADIPYVLVDFTIDPMFNNLNNVGDVEVFTGGYRGIIIYRASLEEFKAYERTCTYDPTLTCSRLVIDPGSNIMALDTCCGSSFLLLDGIPNSGPATVPLKQYRTSFDAASSLLRVFN